MDATGVLDVLSEVLQEALQTVECAAVKWHGLPVCPALAPLSTITPATERCTVLAQVGEDQWARTCIDKDEECIIAECCDPKLTAELQAAPVRGTNAHCDGRMTGVS